MLLPPFTGELKDKKVSDNLTTFTCDFKQQYELSGTEVYKWSTLKWGLGYQ